MLFMVVEKFRNQDGKAVYRKLRDEGREVVGVVTAKAKKGEQITLCIPVNDLKLAIANAP